MKLEGKKLKRVIDPVLAKALAHPLRGHILVRMDELGRVSPSQVGAELGLVASDVSYHFRVLNFGRVIGKTDVVQRRGFAEHFFELARPVLRFDDSAWARMPGNIRDSFTGELLRDVVAELVAALERRTLAEADAHFTRVRVLADEQGRKELAEAEREGLERRLAIKRRCAARLKKRGRDEGTSMTVVAVCFERAQAVDSAA